MRRFALYVLMIVLCAFLISFASASQFTDTFDTDGYLDIQWGPFSFLPAWVYGGKAHLKDDPSAWELGEVLPFCDLKYLRMGMPGSPEPPYFLTLEWSEAPPAAWTPFQYQFWFKLQNSDWPDNYATFGLFNDTEHETTQYRISVWIDNFVEFPTSPEPPELEVDIPLTEAEYLGNGSFRIIVDNDADTISFYYGLSGNPPFTPVPGNPFSWAGADDYQQIHLFSDYWTDNTSSAPVIDGVAVDNVDFIWGEALPTPTPTPTPTATPTPGAPADPRWSFYY